MHSSIEISAGNLNISKQLLALGVEWGLGVAEPFQSRGLAFVDIEKVKVPEPLGLALRTSFAAHVSGISGCWGPAKPSM